MTTTVNFLGPCWPNKALHRMRHKAGAPVSLVVSRTYKSCSAIAWDGEHYSNERKYLPMVAGIHV